MAEYDEAERARILQVRLARKNRNVRIPPIVLPQDSFPSSVQPPVPVDGPISASLDPGLYRKDGGGSEPV